MRVVVAGASGFVGRQLIQELRKEYDVIALSRAPARMEPAQEGLRAVEWRSCDLFSLLQVEQGIEGADIGVYLVHSMVPSARLSQGQFDDFDLIVADNFVRASEKQGLKQILYLGGILPTGKPLSRHLQSRHEVERVFTNRSVPVTVLRAAMIIGAEGSSFNIMIKLIERLPVMLLPKWAETKSQPVALDDVVASLCYCIGNPHTFNHIYDLAGPDQLSYREMMEQAACELGLKRAFVRVSLIPMKLSRIWVSQITGAPKSLIQPLIESLGSEMIANPTRRLTFRPFKTYRQALREALSARGMREITPHAFQQSPRQVSEVRSVQRLLLPGSWNAETVAHAYMRWLPKLIPWFLTVRTEDQAVRFGLRGLRLPLLTLEYSPQRSRKDRQLFYIRGGLLAHGEGKGRLEFREALEHEYVLAAIHNFKPSLPWYIYTWTQARVHLWVMHRFAKYLREKRKQGSTSLKAPL